MDSYAYAIRIEVVRLNKKALYQTQGFFCKSKMLDCYFMQC